jgi:hypothetical protein
MRETHAPHFFHDAVLVKLPNGHEFFVDAIPPADAPHLKSEDAHVGNALCVYAFFVGLYEGTRARDDYELSGWNNGGTGI